MMAANSAAKTINAGAGVGAGGGGDDASAMTVEQFLKMTDAERASLPKARLKKMNRLAEIKKKKEAKEGQLHAQEKAVNSSNSSKDNSTAAVAKARSATAAAAPIAVDKTPPGQKKIMVDMPPTYQPSYVECAWGEWWQRQGFFHADEKRACAVDESQRFVMVIPPPNVTGTLHLGHALMATVEDALTRWHRMSGRVALYLPGVDHAGIATQAVVEKKLARERGQTRLDIGRDAFVAEVWKWKDEYGGRIINQLRRLGISADWSREEFTLSDRLSRAVREAFVRLYDDGLVYRDTRLVNWCCKLRTALSDVEVDYVDIAGRTLRRVPNHDKEVEFGVLTHFAYRVKDSDKDEELVVATTRLETMLGDSGVAVHPNDKRYEHLIGRALVHPFAPDRDIRVVADDVLVDMEFGTGVVKITPAHDPKDFQCGRRHGLPEITVIGDDGRMNELAGERFAGLMRYDARVAVERAMSELGLLRGKADNPMRLGVCSRTGDVIEPLLKPQWWVNCKDMARRSVEAVKSGALRIVPSSFETTWFSWLENILDWCVSRQLWWGHRIPAYHATTTAVTGEAEEGGTWVVGRDENEARQRASSTLRAAESEITLSQDEDVLDTWFSSGLFPFSVFGWPDETDDFKAFFPTTLLETGHDIIFFWVARMVMMSLALTDQLPFKTVYLHAMVRDKEGRKMSKSYGNVVDPIDVISGITLDELHFKLSESNLDAREIERAERGQKENFPKGIPECGADALRIGLLAYTQQARDINLDVQRVVGYRNFGNKLWNVSRFALMRIGGDFVYSESGLRAAVELDDPMDRFILHAFNVAAQATNRALEEFSFSTAVFTAHNFWLHDLCDVYVEAIKPLVNAKCGDDGMSEAGEARDAKRLAACHTLYYCLHHGLRLLHPFMPFVTEELFQRLPNRHKSDAAESIVVSSYPTGDDSLLFPEAYEKVQSAMEVVRSTRSLRALYNVPPSARPELFVLCRDGDTYAVQQSVAEKVRTLGDTGEVHVLRSGIDKVPPGCGANVVNELIEVHVNLAGLVDPEVELTKLRSGAEQKRLLIEGYEKKMGAPNYEQRVPQHVQHTNLANLTKYKQELETLEALTLRFEKIRH